MALVRRLFLRLEFVQRRPDGRRALSLSAAEHVLDAAAPHHPVFARADPGVRPDVLPHVPLLLPRTPWVGVGHVGQLLVRKHRALQAQRSEEHTSELQSRLHLVCRLLLEKKKKKKTQKRDTIT